ncbi:MAG: hypothetical protein JO308_15020 [Verrucomicrobia bacterium]|nr:hypothetical protein [Verrucomicrobiota bacterium]
MTSRSSANTVLTGGIVALGTMQAGLSAGWQSGLRIVPDSGLLQGTKIPPIVPSLVDVRITNFQTSADFPP